MPPQNCRKQPWGMVHRDAPELNFTNSHPTGTAQSPEQRPQHSPTGNVHESAAHCSSCGARVRLWPWMISLPISRNVVSHERSRCSPLPSRNDRFSSDRKGSLPSRSLFAGLCVATARSAESGEEVRRSQRGRAGRYLSSRPRSRRTPLMRRINCQARLVSYSAIVRMDGMT